MEVVQYILDEVKNGHQMLDGVMQELTPEVITFSAGGTSNTIQQLLAHVVTGQDAAVNRAILGGEAVFNTDGWPEKTGIPAERGGIWNKDWNLNLEAFAEYMQAQRLSVYAGLEKIRESDFNREVPWAREGMVRSVRWLINSPVTTHVFLHAGEISTLKGMQGLRGLPM